MSYRGPNPRDSAEEIPSPMFLDARPGGSKGLYGTLCVVPAVLTCFNSPQNIKRPTRISSFACCPFRTIAFCQGFSCNSCKLHVLALSWNPTHNNSSSSNNNNYNYLVKLYNYYKRMAFISLRSDVTHITPLILSLITLHPSGIST